MLRPPLKPLLFPLPFRSAGIGVLALSLLAVPARPQTACREPAADQFKAVTLVETGLTEAIHLAVAPDGRVFIAQLNEGNNTGRIKVYRPRDNTVVEAGTIPVRFETFDGLLGIALAPDFARTGWLYAFYTVPDAVNRAHELARFTVTGDRLGNKKTILRLPRLAGGNRHTGGGMAFDGHGVLVLSTGDDTWAQSAENAGFGPIYWPDPKFDAQKSSSNSNDLRGKILRIKPRPFGEGEAPAPGAGSTYDIPPGNLWETIPALLPEEDAGKVRKEIYAMGNRNPFRLGVDTRSGWIFWGDVGPDANADVPNRGRMGYEEFNLALGPGFFGHPYFNGNNFAYNFVDYSVSPPRIGAKFDPLATYNNSPHNTGIRKMPPPIPALVWYAGNDAVAFREFGAGQETGMSGPMYRYDPALASARKFPAWFEGRVFFWDWSRRTVRTIALNPDGSYKDAKPFTVAGFDWGSNISMEFGPDGALYVLRYSVSAYSDKRGALQRIDYAGPSDAACYQPFAASTPVSALPGEVRRRMVPGQAGGFLVFPAGYRSLELRDLAGRLVWTYRRPGDGPATVRLPRNLSRDVLLARFSP